MLAGFDPRGRRLHERVTAAAGDAPTLSAGPLALAAFDGSWTDGRSACALAGRLVVPGAADRRTAPDEAARALAESFRRTGPAVVEGLRGEFLVAIWDAERGAGMVARDGIGLEPAFTAEWVGGLLVGSEIGDLLAALPRRPSPDRDAVLDVLADTPHADERTLYAGISPLPGGFVVTLRPDGWARRRYWTPEFAEPQRIGAERAAAELGEAIAAAGADLADPAKPVSVLLSGGIDSTVVAALAAPRLRAGGGLHALSLAFPGHPETDEEPLVRSTARAIAVPATIARCQGGSPLAFAMTYVERWQALPFSMNGYAMEPLLRAAGELGATTVIDGEGGDELFGLSPWLVADRLLGGRPDAAWRLLRSIPGAPAQSRRTLLRYGGVKALAGRLPVTLLRALRRPRADWLPSGTAWALPGVRRELRAREDPFGWRRLEGPLWWRQLAHSLVGLRQQLGYAEMLRRVPAMAGLRDEHPLLRRELVELVLSFPPELAFDARVDRPLARRAVEGLVPDDVRLRTRKSFFDPVLVAVTAGADLAAARALVAAPGAELRSLVDVDALCRDLDRPTGLSSVATRAVWRLAALEVWLRSQSDPELPARVREGLPPAAPRIDWVRAP